MPRSHRPWPEGAAHEVVLEDGGLAGLGGLDEVREEGELLLGLRQPRVDVLDPGPGPAWGFRREYQQELLVLWCVLNFQSSANYCQKKIRKIINCSVKGGK